jgi:hypothetical protein
MTEQLGGFARVALLFGDPKLYSFHIGGENSVRASLRLCQRLAIA